MSPLSSVSRRRAFLALPAAVAVAAVLPGATAPTRTAAQSTIAFSTPSVVDPLQIGGEPDITVDPQGRVFASAPTGTGTQRSIWYGSVDGGTTYRPISANKPADTTTTFAAPPGGGDTDIQTDRAGKQYFTDLYALACFRTAVTSDGGATTSSSPTGGCAKTNGSAGDRQWLTVYDPAPGMPNQSAYTGPKPLVYMEYNGVANVGGPGSSVWVMSNATNDPAPGPGLNYTDAISTTPGGSLTYNPFGADGYPSIDQVTGKVFEANYNSSPTTGVSNIDLNIGTPDAAGILTFRDETTTAQPTPPGLIRAATNVADDRGDAANFVVSSIDQGRNLWIAWVARSTDAHKSQTYVAVASAASGWKTWSTPVQVSAPTGSGKCGSGQGSFTSIFPWIKAGGAGRADVVWYGADCYTDPSTNNGQSWNTFMSQVVWPLAPGAGGTGVNTGAAPTTDQVQVSPHPMKYGDICLAGTACIAQQGNRNLADFFNIAIDNTGAAEIIYDDTSNGLSQSGGLPVSALQPGGNQTLDHSGAPVLTVARQSSGPGLFGNNISGPSSAITSGLSDPAGDALYPVLGGKNQPGMDLLGTQMSIANGTLKIVTSVADLSNPAGTATALNAAFLQYVTRWQMGNTIYYAGYGTGITGQPMFYAGPAQSIDLCSVSACDPHVIYYPELGPSVKSEAGKVTCPPTPTAATPCSVEIDVPVADVGNPAATTALTANAARAQARNAAGSMPLEEIGTYSFASLLPQATINNATAQADMLPLEIDGLCCFNGVRAATTTPGGGTTTSGGGAPPTPGAGTTATPTGLANTARAGTAGTGAAVTALIVGLVATGRRRRGRRPGR